MSDVSGFTVRLRRGEHWDAITNVTAIAALEIAARYAKEGTDAEILDSAGCRVWPRMGVQSVPPQARKRQAGRAALFLVLAWLAALVIFNLWLTSFPVKELPADWPAKWRNADVSR